jgi:hypothetical protein
MQFGDRGLNEIMNDRSLGDERVSDARHRIAPLPRAPLSSAETHRAMTRKRKSF